MMASAAVRLEPVTSANWRGGLAVRAEKGQAQFVAGYEPVLLVILAKMAVRVGGVDWWPFLLKDQDRTVGVVGVADHREYHKSLVIFHLLVDESQQRRGYGRAALQRLVELSRHSEGCDSLQLTVHPENVAAVTLYKSAGFEVTVSDADGELQMTRSVDAASV